MTPIPTNSVLENFRPDSANRKLAERLLDGDWHDKTDLAAEVGANLNAVPYVVQQLRLLGLTVSRRVNPATRRVSYHVGVVRDRHVQEAEVPVPANTNESDEPAGPARIRIVGEDVWVWVHIPGLGDFWGRSTETGDIVDLRTNPPSQ
jgi:hypothetical protein